ncbi:MAG: hypothetical protein CSB16_01630 [Clostridiales bacterium]|nr:MAG: hypothetical protein CSB16_01630 [Clostridiales bacterium]
MKKKIILFLAILVLLAMPSFATIEEQIDEVDKKIEESSSNIEQLEQNIEEEEKNLEVVSVSLEETLVQKQALEARIEQTKNNIITVENKIKELKEKIKKAKAEIQAQEKHFGARLRSIYYKKDETFWTVIFDAEGIEDLMTRLSSFEKITQQDDKTLNDLIDKRNQLAKMEEEQKNNLLNLESLKSAQEKDKADLIAVEAELERRKSELQARIAEHKSLMQQEQSQAAQFQQEKDDLLAEAERIRLENYNKNNNTEEGENVELPPIDTGTGWVYPAPGTFITYWFGYRVHPLYGTDDWHSGIDMIGDFGNPIYAARGGLVVVAGWYGGFGNCVVIDHGDGLQTLYGHGDSVLVSVGDQVSQGQHIMVMGSTGTSTAPHLHFSVLYGGDYVDPAPYIGL